MIGIVGNNLEHAEVISLSYVNGVFMVSVVLSSDSVHLGPLDLRGMGSRESVREALVGLIDVVEEELSLTLGAKKSADGPEQPRGMIDF